MIYHFAIDETGNFNFSDDDESFACGVLVRENELGVKERYREAYEKLGLGRPAPNKTSELIGRKDACGKYPFHFAEQSAGRREACRKILLPLASMIFVSRGKPLLWANNQSFWLTAVVSVILELFKKIPFGEGDVIKIEIESRKNTVWGLAKDDVKKDPGFNEYHNDLIRQIDNFIAPYRANLGIRTEIRFTRDTDSFFVNLADIVCGLVRADKGIGRVECRCESVMSVDDPARIMEKNPAGALSAILTKALNGRFEDAALIQGVFKRTRTDDESYNAVWSVFRNFLQSRKNTSHDGKNTKSKLYDIVKKFLKEFKSHPDKIAVDTRLDLINLFVSFYSHIGAIATPIEKDFFVKQLNDTGPHSENRITRKWEKYISFFLHGSQIQFNAYNFSGMLEESEKIWATQEKIIKLDYPFSTQTGAVSKDEHTAAIIGTLAHSYAFIEKIDEAIMYFEESMTYAVKTRDKAESYLLTLYFMKQDIEKAREHYNNLPESVWKQRACSMLRALELYKTGKTGMPKVPTDGIGAGYPAPMILKWAAVAECIDRAGDRREAAKHLSKAADNLLKGKFTAKTTALPVIQVLALADDENQYIAKYDYGAILKELKEESETFARYVEESKPALKTLENGLGVWERATILPFHYL